MSLFLMLLLSGQQLLAQKSKTRINSIPSTSSTSFRNLSKSQTGLIDNSISDIVQDKQGHIWVGSNEGLSSYDGHRFVAVFDEFLKSVVIADTNVTDLAVGADGRLWILTNSALHSYEHGTGEFKTIVTKDSAFEGIPLSVLLSIEVTNNGELWLVTDSGILKGSEGSENFKFYNKATIDDEDFNPRRVFISSHNQIFISGLRAGLWLYEPKLDKFVRFTRNIDVLEKEDRTIRAIKRIETGDFWAVTNFNILKLDSEGNIVKIINQGNADWLKQARLEDLIIDANNNLIIASKGAGFYYLNAEGELIERFESKLGKAQTLASNFTNRLLLDEEKTLWIGTENNGISLWKNQVPFIQRIEFESNKDGGLSDGIIWSIYQDKNDRLWIGTNNGLNLWDASQQKFKYFNLGQMSSGDPAHVLAIAETSDGLIWLSTGLGLMSLEPSKGTIRKYKTKEPRKDGVSAAYIFSLFTDSRDRLWIGNIQGVSYLDKGSSEFVHLTTNSFENNNLSSNEVGAVAEDEFGDIWLGTSKGMCKYYYKFNNFDCKIKNYGGISPKDTYLVNAILLDNDFLWVGYSGNGLLKLEINSPEEKFTQFKSGNGIPGLNVSALLKDKLGRLWMSSQNGLVVFNPQDGSYKVIGAEDGLENAEFNESSFAQLNDGRFAFGTVSGVVVVEPEKFQFKDKKSIVSLSGIYSLSDQTEKFTLDNISLPEERSGLKINFSNLNYFNPEQSLYQYKSGKNKQWIDLKNKSEILFAESRSGDHNIYIRSKYQGGDWGPEKLISFNVYPPLWRSNFFMVLYAVLGAAILFGFLRYRQQQLVEKYKMLDTIKENEQQLRLSLDASEQGVWDWKTTNDFMTRSKTKELLHIYAPETLVEYWALIQESDRLNVIKAWNAHLFGKQQNYHCQYRIKLDDEEIWIEEQGRAIERDKFGMAIHISGTYRNITHTKVIEKNLTLLAKAFEDTAEGMLIVDGNLDIVQVNHAVTEITGYTETQLIGSSISARAKNEVPISFLDDVWQAVAEKGLWQGEVWQKNSDDEDIPLWLNVSEIKDEDETDVHYVLIMSDMSERKATEEELRYLANYDTLTQLPNRALLRDRLDHALGNARRQHRPLALLFLDLDRFKYVNDSFGHAVGDGLLKVVSERLQECLREDDTVSRLGGDEFVILMEHFSSINAIAGVTEKIRIAMMQPFRLEGIDIQASFSIGVSVYPSDGEDSATLLRNADTAMYHAKSAGRNRVQFYAPKMNETALERLTLENDLRTAIGSGQLEVYYQPQVRSHDASLYGAEALVRWNHPERGMVMPNDFIPMAEESDLIVSLGNEVLYKACVQMQRWKEKHGLDVKISINLAARQLLQVDLARHIENVVTRAGLDSSYVCLEITETAVMEDLERSRKILDALREKGFKIAIDDFGTGYSSLNYLRNIPLDIIKIDYSFVRELLNNSVDQAIVSAIIEIGAALDLQVLAEGIETEQQKKMLLDKGCEIFQGYLFGKPMPAKEFEKFIETSKTNAKVQLENEKKTTAKSKQKIG